jgi:hypothetical protein
MKESEKIFKFNVTAFFVSLLLGIIYVYVTASIQETVVKRPNPFNSHKTLYKSEDGECYKYETKEVDCGEASKIEDQVL